MSCFLNDFIEGIENGAECEHCGCMANETGMPCIACSKVVMGRSFRSSTVDTSARSYEDMEADAESEFGFQTPQRKKQRSESGTTSPRASEGYTESAKSTLSEFASLMRRDGKGVTKAQDDTASKYVRYMRKLFDSGKFTCRYDFFQPDARMIAMSVYQDEARVLADGGSKTPERKHVNNMKWGFDKFVQLADPHEPAVCGNSESASASASDACREDDTDKGLEEALADADVLEFADLVALFE